jgi:hypothetical protein
VTEGTAITPSRSFLTGLKEIAVFLFRDYVFVTLLPDARLKPSGIPEGKCRDLRGRGRTDVAGVYHPAGMKCCDSHNAGHRDHKWLRRAFLCDPWMLRVNPEAQGWRV